MTREEIVEQLDSIIGTYEILIGNGVNSDILGIDDINAIRETIELLQAIDDIKAEIEELKKSPMITLVNTFTVVDVALEIIDKHIEKEVKE